MNLLGDLNGMSDLAHIYAFQQRNTAINNQYEFASLLREQNRIHKESRDLGRTQVELLREAADEAKQKAEKIKTARKLLASLFSRLGRVHNEHSLENTFLLARVQHWIAKLKEQDVFEELSDMRSIDELESTHKQTFQEYATKHGLEGEPAEWAEYLLGEIEQSLENMNSVFAENFVLNPYLEIEINKDFEDIKVKHKQLYDDAMAEAARMKKYKDLVERMPTMTDNEFIAAFGEAGVDKFIAEHDACAARLEQYVEADNAFGETQYKRLREKYDVEGELTQISSLRRSYWGNVRMENIQEWKAWTDGLLNSFVNTVAHAKSCIPEYLLAESSFPEEASLYINENVEPDLFPRCRRAAILLDLSKQGYLYDSILEDLERIQQYAAETGILDEMETMNQAALENNFLQAKVMLMQFNQKYSKLIDTSDFSSEIETKVDILHQCEALKKSIEQSRFSVSRLMFKKKTKEKLTSQLGEMLSKCATLGDGDLKYEVCRISNNVNSLIENL